MNKKISVRFFIDKEIRTIWDNASSSWWFSVIDVVAALLGQTDYNKTRNYWKHLKAKLKNEGNQLVSVTNQFKLPALDSKQRLTDCLDADGVTMLAKNEE